MCAIILAFPCAKSKTYRWAQKKFESKLVTSQFFGGYFR